MIEANLFIGALIVAIVQGTKIVFPQISGILTIVMAMLIGAAIAVAAPYIGVEHVSVAQGILDGLASVGVHTIASAPVSPGVKS